jgi:hypothetical protein
MNTFFEEVLTVVQSEQFANEFKSTIKFILRLVNLLFLVIAGLFTLVKEFLCRQPKGLMETNHESTDEGVINEEALDEGINVETDNTNSILENQTEVISTENDVDLTVEDINNQSNNDKSIRQKELKQMKATELRKLCADYSLQYQNKQQAIGAIFQFEWGQLQANLG